MKTQILLLCAALASISTLAADVPSGSVDATHSADVGALSITPPDPEVHALRGYSAPVEPLKCVDCSEELFIEMLPGWMTEIILDQIDVFDTSSTALIYEWLLTMIVGVACAQGLRRRRVRVRVRRRVSTVD